MAKKNEATGVVYIAESRLHLWGLSERRASLLVESLRKLNEYDLADDVAAILDKCRHGFDVAYAECKVEDNPAIG